MKGFENIIGHERQKSYLSRVAAAENPAHAYIFAGSRGLGKRRVAMGFAALLQKTSETTLSDCRIIDTQGKSIGVDVIREQLVEDVQIAPFSKQWKIYIIRNAQKLTLQAQNAMLKTLEEPPAYAVIILLVNDERKLTETVKSRCVMLQFSAPSEEEAVAHLMAVEDLSRADAVKLVRITDANIGRALKFAERYKEGKPWADIIYVLTHLGEMKTHEILSFVKGLDDDSTDLFLSVLYTYYKDMLYYKLSNEINDLVLPELQRSVMNNVRTMSYKNMYESVDAITEAIRRLEANANRATVFEILLLTIKEYGNGISHRRPV
ncbi:MAG: hypothetical protein Q4P30_01805 [Eubacteriales bacterium]|nr:hypothetical protein [Eubacteriales bacterium]